MFLTYLLIAVVLVAVILLLPYLSGLTKVEIDRTKKTPKQKQKRSDDYDEDRGYVPPDEARRGDEDVAVRSSIRDRMRVTQDDVPFKIKLDREASGLRKRKDKLDINRDPNSYDYDIDELIEEEARQTANENERDFYKEEKRGGTNEDYV